MKKGEILSEIGMERMQKLDRALTAMDTFCAQAKETRPRLALETQDTIHFEFTRPSTCTPRNDGTALGVQGRNHFARIASFESPSFVALFVPSQPLH